MLTACSVGRLLNTLVLFQLSSAKTLNRQAVNKEKPADICNVKDDKTVAKDSSNSVSSSYPSSKAGDPEPGSTHVNSSSHKVVEQLGSQVESGLRLTLPGPEASRLSPSVKLPPAQSPVMSLDPAITAMGELSRNDDDADFTHLETAAMNLLSEDTGKDWEPPSSSPWQTPEAPAMAQAAAAIGSADEWFYKDPQNETQGPFTSVEMLEWFSAGYFTMTLQVKRGCDDIFTQLGELIKKLNKVPFGNLSIPIPFKVS